MNIKMNSMLYIIPPYKEFWINEYDIFGFRYFGCIYQTRIQAVAVDNKHPRLVGRWHVKLKQREPYTRLAGKEIPLTNY